jgi:hypothetical protein
MEKTTNKEKIWLFMYTKKGRMDTYTLAFSDYTIEGARARFMAFVKPQNGDAWQEFRITGLEQEGCHNA